MQRLSKKIPANLAQALDEHFDEICHQNWTIERPNAPVEPELAGYFETAQEALADYAQLRSAFPQLDSDVEIAEVIEADWQNEYKKYLQPWACGNLHWVPVWMREGYALPSGDVAFYFDAGMAFGTGDHPTTRLCALAMQDYIKAHPDYAQKRLIDAGCGSGILALSAALLGFMDVCGFDIDPDSVRIARENAGFNGVQISENTFEVCGIPEGLAGKTADLLLANIQSDILCPFADDLIAGVSSGGALVLSGILGHENEGVKKHFAEKIGARLKSVKADFMGDWSSIIFLMG